MDGGHTAVCKTATLVVNSAGSTPAALTMKGTQEWNSASVQNTAVAANTSAKIISAMSAVSPSQTVYGIQVGAHVMSVLAEILKHI